MHGGSRELKGVTFEAYYFGSEFGGVTEVFHKTGFFSRSGGCSPSKRTAFGVARGPSRPAHAASALVITCAAAGSRADSCFFRQDADTRMVLETSAESWDILMRILIPLWRAGVDSMHPGPDRRP